MPLDPGWAGIIGTALGGVLTIGGNAVIEKQKSRRNDALAQRRRDRLRQMLSGERYTWRSLDLLAAAIGADEATTADLLMEIDARPSLDGTGLWALVSRVGWPDEGRIGT